MDSRGESHCKSSFWPAYNSPCLSRVVIYFASLLLLSIAVFSYSCNIEKKHLHAIEY